MLFDLQKNSTLVACGVEVTCGVEEKANRLHMISPSPLRPVTVTSSSDRRWRGQTTKWTRMIHTYCIQITRIQGSADWYFPLHLRVGVYTLNGKPIISFGHDIAVFVSSLFSTLSFLLSDRIAENSVLHSPRFQISTLSCSCSLHSTHNAVSQLVYLVSCVVGIFFFWYSSKILFSLRKYDLWPASGWDAIIVSSHRYRCWVTSDSRGVFQRYKNFKRIVYECPNENSYNNFK